MITKKIRSLVEPFQTNTFYYKACDFCKLWVHPIYRVAKLMQDLNWVIGEGGKDKMAVRVQVACETDY